MRIHSYQISFIRQFCRPIILAPLLSGLLVCLASPSSAEQGPFRCNGLVQQRPCGQPLATGPSRVTHAAPSVAAERAPGPITPGAFLKVVKQKFSQVSPTEGVWWGTIEGHGTAQLYLAFLRNGMVETRDSMGTVKLDKREGEVSFRFRSATPRLPGWDWRVEGAAS